MASSGRVRSAQDACRDGEHGADQHQDEVAGRPADEARDHGVAPASAACRSSLGGARPCSAAFRLLSASMRKLAEVTTRSPARDAVADLGVAAAAHADLHGLGLEATLAAVDQHDLALAGVDDGVVGHGHDRLGVPRRDLDVGVHVRQQACRPGSAARCAPAWPGSPGSPAGRSSRPCRRRCGPGPSAGGWWRPARRGRWRGRAPARRPAPTSSRCRRSGTGYPRPRPSCPRWRSVAGRCRPRADDQVMAIGTFRVRSISSITASETFRFRRRRRAPSKPGLAMSWAAAALISGE